VIAGVLNLLVIYDALAGPMFRDPPLSTAEAPQPTDSGGPIPLPPPPPANGSPYAPPAPPTPANSPEGRPA
ncbi:MAG TPA: hypothetical protein VLM40_04880, partial [Gemmata sp.]|nr:hypothetical protein [Gemmata sp.]